MKDTIHSTGAGTLSGKKIIVTRAAEQAGEFSALLQSYGANVYECPTIKLVSSDSTAEIKSALKNISSYSWLIFTSVNAVNFFFKSLSELGFDSRIPGSTKVCVVGPKSAEALKAYGKNPDLMPEDYKAEGVVKAFSSIDIAGQHILFPRADKARDVIVKGLEGLGAEVTAPVIYKNVVPGSIPSSALKALENREIDCITFTSSSTAQNLAKILGKNRMLQLLEGVVVASIGPITTKTCNELRLKVDVEPEEYTVKGLTEAIVSHFM
ncbi:MAG: uroporphyrinogen-III synthase [Desulfuromonadales bacterium]|nr:uroporphyrinogen-III synthase [Desulfuromonadales bacterium]